MEGLGNLGTVMSLTQKTKPTFILLQETMLRATNKGDLVHAFPGYRVFVKTADSYLHEEDKIIKQHVSFHGVALGVDSEVISDVEEINVEDPNIIVIKYRGGERNLLVGCLYLPTRGHDKEVRFESALDKLQSCISDHSESDVILIGDVNNDRTSDPRRLRAWGRFIEDTGLTDNWTGTITHTHHITKKQSELDRVLTRGVRPSTEVVDDLGSSSDHVPLLVTAKIQMKPQIDISERFRKCETKIDLTKLNPEEFKEATDQLSALLREVSGVSLDDYNGILSRSIWSLAIQMTGQDRYNEKVTRRKRRRRTVKVENSLYKALRSTRTRFIRTGKVKGSQEWVDYVTARRKLRTAVQNSVMEEESETQRQIIEASQNNDPKIFALLRKIKHGHESKCILPSELSGYGKSYGRGRILEGFRDLFEVQGLMDSEDRYEQDRMEMARDLIHIRKSMRWEDSDEGLILDRETFDKAVRGLATGKAQDSCGLSNDLLKMCGDEMLDLIFDYTLLCFETNNFGGLTRNFGKGTIIVKKQSKPINVIGNWRKIVSNNVLNNLVQYVLQASIERKVHQVQTQYQMGFTKDVPVMHAVIAREEIMALSKRMDWTLFLGILDLKSCFPRIPREQLLHLLAGVVNPQEWALISQIYMETWSDVRVQGMRTDNLRSNIGTVEGGVLSVQLLKLFLSVLLKMLERAGFDSHVNFVTGEVRSGQLCVADDVLLYTWEEETARNMLRICEQWSNRYRATFSLEKSVILIQRAKKDFRVYDAFRLYGEALDVVKEAEHLGTPVVPGDNSEALCLGRLTKARRSLYATLSFFDRKNFLSAAVKLDIWTKIYQPTLLFSHETTSLKASQTRRLEVFHHKMLRAIFGLSRRASRAKLRLVTGQRELPLEIWKLRFSTLNGIITRRTLARRFVLLNLKLDNKNAWSYKTAAKLQEWAEHDAMELARLDKDSFKDGVKGLVRREGLRSLERDLGGTPYSPSPDALDTYNPLILTDFKKASRRDLRGWAKAVTGDYLRLYDQDCPLDHDGPDNSTHLVGRRCRVEAHVTVVQAREELESCVRTNFPHHPLSWGGLPEREWVMFMINPTSLSLGKLRISREDVQYSGLDSLIRKYLASKVRARYEIVKTEGLRNLFTKDHQKLVNNQ